MAQYQLVVRVGPSPGKVYPLIKNELTIGRDINNDIVINDSEISRNHCRLVMSGDSYLIEDLGSTNGTWINEQRLTASHQLQNGENFRLGDNVVLEYGLEGEDEDATVVSAGATPQTVKPAPKPAAKPAAKPARPAAPPPQAEYAGQVPASLVPVKKKGLPKGLIIGCGGLIVIAACIGLGLLLIDSLKLWCAPGIGNIIQMFGYYCP